MANKKEPPILVSACLAGVPCRYDGESREREIIVKLLSEGKAIPVCPEQMGGLPTPRLPAEIRDNLVLTKNGDDVTNQYKAGAENALMLMLKAGCREAWLKSKSPMCGCGKIYDGTHQGKLTQGDGLFTRLIKKAGIKVKEID